MNISDFDLKVFSVIWPLLKLLLSLVDLFCFFSLLYLHRHLFGCHIDSLGYQNELQHLENNVNYSSANFVMK